MFIDFIPSFSYRAERQTARADRCTVVPFHRITNGLDLAIEVRGSLSAEQRTQRPPLSTSASANTYSSPASVSRDGLMDTAHTVSWISEFTFVPPTHPLQQLRRR